MFATFTKRVVASGFVASATLFGMGVAPAAAEPFVFPAGTACAFPLSYDTGGFEDSRNVHEFKDADGNTVVLKTGRGTPLTLKNEDTGATLSLRANGAPTREVFRPDGTSTVTSMGHNILILFPTDVPAGPSTTLYVGQVVFDIDYNTGVFTLKHASGKATDICAALAN